MPVVHTIILAAGQGKRMRSALPKVLHRACGKTLLEYVAALAFKLKPNKVHVIVPKQHTAFKALPLFVRHKPQFVVQPKQLGTGHALKCALKNLPRQGTAIVLSGDMPLIQIKTVQNLLQKQSGAAVGFLTACLPNPYGYGRVLRGFKDEVLGIVEERDATAEQRQIPEVNVGVYAFDLEFLHQALHQLQDQNEQREYYLTDLIGLAVEQGRAVQGICLGDAAEAQGVNTPEDLNRVAGQLYQRQRQRVLANGGTLIGEEIFIDAEVSLGSGVSLESPCYLKGATRLGDAVVVETGCVLKDAVVGSHSVIKAHCYLDQAVVGAECHVGPFAHLRPQTRLANEVKIGNFVETKKTSVGSGSKINHLSYLGDAHIGKAVNVGAGTITCNYDGVRKHKTRLADGVFIGSDTQLVAPVSLGKNAYVGAGTTVTANVAKNSLVVSRVPQKVIKDWAKHRKIKK